MAKQFPNLEDAHCEFMARQKIFFVASAAPQGRVNVSPKGMDCFRILGPNRVAYLDLTGSGNETSAHIAACADRRLTIMFCALEGAPLILRLYGSASLYRCDTAEFETLRGQHFSDLCGARQIIALDVELVQTSCGYAVPLFEYIGDRDNLVRWAEHKGSEGLEEYRREKNAHSLDGLPASFAE